MNVLSKIIKKKKIKDDYFISLDIGVEIVKALVLHLDRNEDKVYVLGFGSEQQQVGNIKGGDIQNDSGVILTCKKAIEKAAAMTDIKPKKVIIGINGEFTMGMAMKMEYQRNDPKLKIDMDEIKDIVYTMQKDILEKIKNKIKKESDGKRKIKVTSADIVDISIDGYRVMSPIGFKGNKIEFNMFNSFLYSYKFDIIKKIANELQLTLLDVVSESYAVAMSIGAQDNTEFNAILVDIGGRTTNVAIVHDGNVEDVVTFNIGGRAFTKSLSGELGINMEEAEKLKIEYSENKVNEDLKDKIKEIFAYDCDVLFTGVEISLKEFSSSNLLPAQIILYGGGSQLFHINEIISKSFLKKDSSFLSKTKIKFVDIDDIINIVDKTNKIKGYQYINSMSLANFVLDSEDVDNNSVNIILRDLIRKSY